MIVSLKNRKSSWPPLPTEYVKKSRRRQALPPLVDPSDVTVLGQVESKDDTSDRGETPSKKVKKSPHKSPAKKKGGKTTDFQADLKSMDDKWSEHFARLEAMFLARSFQVPLEPVQKSDVVSDRPFIPPVQQSTGFTGQKQSSSAASQREVKKATQPVEAPSALTATRPTEAPGAVVATQPVEAPGASSEIQPTGQDSSVSFDVDRPEMQPPGPASQIFYSGRPEVQPPGPAAQPATVVKKSATFPTGSGVPVEELAAEAEQLSDRASSNADEGEVSDLVSSGPDWEELLDVDKEVSAEQTYRETMRSVRSFMAWNDIPEFDSSTSSTQDDNPSPVPELHIPVKCL